MVGISVMSIWPPAHAAATLRSKDALPIAEEVEGLDESGIIVSAAFIERHEDRGMLEQLRFGLYALYDVTGERFEQVEFEDCGCPSVGTSGLT